MIEEKVWGITMLKDEEDVAFHVIQHMAEEGLDAIIAVDNYSHDKTLDLLTAVKDTVDCPVFLYQDDEVAYYQSKKMTALANKAAEKGATWIVPFDADEIWYCHDERVGNYLRDQSPEVLSVGARLWNHFRTDFDEDGNPFESMVYKHPDPAPLVKVAFRPVTNFVLEAGNHAVTQDGISLPCEHPESPPVEIRHFPYRSFDQFKNKAINGGRAYENTDLPIDVGAHWREYFAIWQRGGSEALKEIYDQWFQFKAPISAGMILDPAPFRRWVLDD